MDENVIDENITEAKVFQIKKQKFSYVTRSLKIKSCMNSS